MTYQANPLDAMTQTFNALQGAQDQRTRNQAGRAYAGGDARGAANALAQGGMVEQAADLEYRGAQREAQLSAQERAEAERRTTAMMQGVRALQGVPFEQRAQAFEQLAPTLSAFMPAEVIEKLRAADKSDQALGAFGTAIGAEAQRLQLFQQRSGDIIGVDPVSGSHRMVFDGPEQTPDAPNGYRWTAGGGLEAIPGGPSDTTVVRARADAGRAPARPRASAGRGSRPASPRPAPGGSGLPAGFTVRRR